MINKEQLIEEYLKQDFSIGEYVNFKINWTDTVKIKVKEEVYG